MARVEVHSSVFCTVRESQPTPLCAFYTAMTVRALSHFGIAASARVEQCHAMSGKACVLALDLGASGAVPAPAMAA
jgi:hypothetical protein